LADFGLRRAVPRLAVLALSGAVPRLAVLRLLDDFRDMARFFGGCAGDRGIDGFVSTVVVSPMARALLGMIILPAAAIASIPIAAANLG
jgi:hypothetical protein